MVYPDGPECGVQQCLGDYSQGVERLFEEDGRRAGLRNRHPRNIQLPP